MLMGWQMDGQKVLEWSPKEKRMTRSPTRSWRNKIEETMVARNLYTDYVEIKMAGNWTRRDDDSPLHREMSRCTEVNA